MNIEPYKASDLYNLDLQDGQAYLSDWVTVDQAKALEDNGWAYTGFVNDKPIACIGLLPIWQGRGMAWAYISCEAVGRQFIPIHKAVSRFLDACYLQRIEMTVDCEFEAGHRWARMLGFEMEAECMKSYRPDGGDCSLYARVL